MDLWALRPKLALLVVAAILSFGFLATANYFPLASSQKIYVPVRHTRDSVELTTDQSITQRIIAEPGIYSGVVLFSNSSKFTGQGLAVTVTDKSKNQLATSNYASAKYLPAQRDAIELTFATTRFVISEPTHLFINLESTREFSLNLLASTLDQNLYASGELRINDAKTTRDLAVSLLQPAPLNNATKQGVLVAVIFLIALVAIQFLAKQKHQWIAAGILIVLITPLALAGYWFSLDALGIADWDYYFSLHHIYRQTITQFSQLPHWNPYTCGGTAGLADPESPFFTPTFLLELIFGIPVGLRLAIFFATATGGLGTLLLAKSVGLRVNAALLAALAATFGTVTLLEITEGHVNVFAAMWIPWIFWAWLNAYRKQNLWILSTGAFLALTFFQGGIYLLMYTTIAFIALPFFVSRPRQAIKVTIQAAVWALGLAAIKLIPVLYWLRQFPDDAFASSAYTLPWLTDIFFGRNLHGSYIIPLQNSGWHEYGAYIGYFVFALALIGAARFYRSPIIRMLVVAAIAATLLSATGPYLKPFFDYLWFFPRSNISRIILFAIIPISLLAGFGLQTLMQRVTSSTGKILTIIIISLVALDLFTLTSQLSYQAFVLPEVYPAPSPAPAPIAFTTERFDAAGSGSRTTRAYAATLQGYGTFTYCSVLGPQPAVLTIHDEVDNGVMLIEEDAANFQLVSWSPNRAVFDIDTPTPSKAVLNTNFAQGWYVNDLPAQNSDNRVAAVIDSGEQRLTFRFRTPGFRLGLIISGLTFLAAIYKLRPRQLRKKSTDPT